MDHIIVDDLKPAKMIPLVLFSLFWEFCVVWLVPGAAAGMGAAGILLIPVLFLLPPALMYFGIKKLRRISLDLNRRVLKMESVNQRKTAQIQFSEIEKIVLIRESVFETDSGETFYEKIEVYGKQEMFFSYKTKKIDDFEDILKTIQPSITVQYRIVED